MYRFVASTPKSEVSGKAMQAFTEAMVKEEILPVLKDHGITELDANHWYSHQFWLDILRDIAERKVNVSEYFVAIGMKVIDTAAFPPMISSLENALQSLPVAYQLDHRNQSEKGWIVELAAPRKAIIVAENPYPDDVDYGVVWALVRRFRPKGIQFTVRRITPDAPDADPTYEVVWG